LGDIDDPQRLAGFPGLARQTYAGPVLDGARALEELLDDRVVDAPSFYLPHHLPVRIRTQITAALPAFRLADRPDDRVDRCAGVIGIRDERRHREAEGTQVLLAL